ncbi:MAG: hypothetical protein HOV86_01795 [Thermoactinospora sp.]|nr:hypothetical protein [Thermoactinospora sp.]
MPDVPELPESPEAPAEARAGFVGTGFQAHWTPPGLPPERPGPLPPLPRPEPMPLRSPSYSVHVTHDPIAERLFEQRIVLAHGELTEQNVTPWCAGLLTLGAIGRQPIKLHLSIPDGELGAVLTMLDTLDSLTVEVHAQVTGRLGGPAMALLAAVTRRRGSPNSLFRMGEPHLTAHGTTEEVLDQQEQNRRMLDTIYWRLSDLTGKEVDEIRHDSVRGRHLNVEEAIAYGLLEGI